MKHVQLLQATQITDAPRIIGYVSAKLLGSLLDCSETTIWAWAKKGIIPKPVQIGGSARWKWSDVENYIKPVSINQQDDDDPIMKASRGTQN